jgi:hypothetical protein
MKRQLVGVSSQLCIVDVARSQLPPREQRVRAPDLAPAAEPDLAHAAA